MRFALVAALIVGCTPLTSAAPTQTNASSPSLPSLSASASPPATSNAASSASPSATASPASGVVGSGTFVSSTAARATGDPESAKRAAAGIRSLAAELYRELANTPANLVFSPYSAAAALAMTRVGASGSTAAQMDAVLHRAEVGDLDAAFNALDLELARRTQSAAGYGHTPLELTTANRLWAQRGLTFASPFLDRLSAYYGAGVGLVDYVNAREAARSAINAWVSDRTNARIAELVKKDMLNELTRFVLTDAIYFKAQWSRPFLKSATAAGPFRRLDGTTTQAMMMRDAGSGLYARGNGYQTVSLSYTNGQSMIVIVPDAGTFAAFERALDARTLASIDAALESTYVILQMPKFEFRTSAPLKAPLERLGMPIAFTDAADFSAITKEAKLVLQDVVQEAFIAVDEDGTEAAAATAVFGGATGAPSHQAELVVDRPFLFLIRDDFTGAILFMGRVLDPTAG